MNGIYQGNLPWLLTGLAALLCSLVGGYTAARLSETSTRGLGPLSGLSAGLVALLAGAFGSHLAPNTKLSGIGLIVVGAVGGGGGVVLALEGGSGKVVGFINALSDNVLSACIPLLEVLPAYRGQGIGSELVRKMLERLNDLYAVDLICDPALQPFYAALGMRPATGMMVRNYALQSGKGE